MSHFLIVGQNTRFNIIGNIDWFFLSIRIFPLIFIYSHPLLHILRLLLFKQERILAFFLLLKYIIYLCEYCRLRRIFPFIFSIRKMYCDGTRGPKLTHTEKRTFIFHNLLFCECNSEMASLKILFLLLLFERAMVDVAVIAIPANKHGKYRTVLKFAYKIVLNNKPRSVRASWDYARKKFENIFRFSNHSNYFTFNYVKCYRNKSNRFGFLMICI